MPESKHENSLLRKDLSQDIAGEIASFLSKDEALNLLQTSKTSHTLFNSSFDKHRGLKVRICVVQGDVDQVIWFAQHRPTSLLDKGSVTDLTGRVFHHVSAIQLILFLCDVDMLNRIKFLIPQQFIQKTQQQSAEMGCGGADLVKLDFDPLAVASGDNFKEVTQIKFYWKGFTTLTLPLLENPDGIICYQDKKREIHFYYVNRLTKEIRELAVCCNSEQEILEWEQFKASFDSLENNSSRRSSNAEHDLISRVLKCTLQREGIVYTTASGIQYCDSQTEFNLIHAYRTCMRLYIEAKQNRQWNKVNRSWCTGVGKAQAEVMWLLQYLCGATLLDRFKFSTFNKEYVFHRGYQFTHNISYDISRDHMEFEITPIISKKGTLVPDLGSKFALTKHRGMPESAKSARWPEFFDFFCNTCQLVTYAKTNIMKWRQKTVLDTQERSTCILS